MNQFNDNDQIKSIQRLDCNSKSLIKSGFYLKSLNEIILDLIKISINLNSNKILISINFNSLTISIEDNGIPLDKNFLKSIGNFNQLIINDLSNSNSNQIKNHSLSNSQIRILDSLSHLSLLDITTRSFNSNLTHQIIYKNGQIIFSGPAKTGLKYNQGNTITVRDLFYNLPVRRIHQTIPNPNKLHHHFKRQWENFIINLKLLAIAHPNINFVLRNLTTHPIHHQIHQTSHQIDCFRITKTGNSIKTFGKVFGSQLVQHSIIINSNLNGFHLYGLFGKNKNSCKSAQLLYFNQSLLSRFSSVYKTLNNLFSKLTPSQNSVSLSNLIQSSSNQINPIAKTSTSLIDRHPIYLFMITLAEPSSTTHGYQFYLDQSQNILSPLLEERLNKVFSKLFSQVFPNLNTQPTITKFSVEKSSLKNSFSVTDPTPDYSGQTKREILLWRGCSESSSQVSLKRPSSSTSLSTYPMSQKRYNGYRVSSGPTRSASSILKPSNRHLDLSTFSNSTPSRPVSPKSPVSPSHEELFTAQPSSSMRPLCPLFNQLASFHKVSKHFTKDCDLSAIRIVHPSPVEPLSKDFNQSKNLELPQWIKESLLDYQNPVFGFKPRDQTLHNAFSNPLSKSYNHNQKANPLDLDFLVKEADNMRCHEEGLASQFEIDLSKLSESKYRLIGQLDRKFLIVKLDPDLIVAFDQHAVHERIRVERYLKEFCQGNFKMKRLDAKFRPQEEPMRKEGVPMIINQIEYDAFCRFQDLFLRWGFVYRFCKPGMNLVNQEEEDELLQIFVIAVPELIWCRIVADGFEMMGKVLRGCLSFFEARTRDGLNQKSSIDEESLQLAQEDWFKSCKDCPTILIDLLNSKACRGSIMFGDKLTATEMKKLLKRLGKTKKPFQCAHDRPTCYPLIKLSLIQPELNSSQEPFQSSASTNEQYHPTPQEDLGQDFLQLEQLSKKIDWKKFLF
ncbi:hypothetical protein O181_030861 [Austropuccinia psidii MF-1]|uniref:MutL C-terminal dimerisation domain-containing protein n=1 Tax=Austropuccinia psidii MF-1 TaxID=1389203 RepID=A0A9Q3CTR7_9BASI|nr:hypothetical protein [Austropuccinia psidii MF-1]